MLTLLQSGGPWEALMVAVMNDHTLNDLKQPRVITGPFGRPKSNTASGKLPERTHFSAFSAPGGHPHASARDPGPQPRPSDLCLSCSFTYGRSHDSADPPRDPSLHLEILKFVTDAQSFSLSKVTYSQVLGVRMWTSCGGGGH